jgi:hypothetical protein
MRKSFGCIALLFAIPALAQNTPQSIALKDTSNIPIADISKAFAKKCSSVSITPDATKADFTLEANKRRNFLDTAYDLTLSDEEGITRGGSDPTSLDGAVKELCRALKAEFVIEVVDPENQTQSVDLRGNTTVDAYGNPTKGGLNEAAVGIVNATTGRRTHTDATTMAVIVNGEHALLDCFEHEKGCVPIGPGKYYAELAHDKKSLWVDHDVPISHVHVRDHYVIAGSW